MKTLTASEMKSLEFARRRIHWKVLPLIYVALGIGTCIYPFRHANEFLSTVNWEQVDHNTLMLFKGAGWGFMAYILLFIWPVIGFFLFGHPNDRLLVKLHDRITDLEDKLDHQESSRT